MNGVKEQQAVYVLNRRAYQESSLIIDVFSLNYGRFSAVAKGAMRKGNVWSASLQPFCPLLLSWSGRSSLKTLRSVDMPGASYNLSSNYLFSGYYLNELVTKLLPENEVSETVFSSYVSSLVQLSEGRDLQRTLRSFEHVLLQELGVLPDFTHDIQGKPIRSEGLYRLIFQQGFEAVESSVIASKGSLTIAGNVIRLLDGKALDVSSVWSEGDYMQAKSLMRCLVDDALGGQVIKSRELFKSLKYKG